MSTSFLTSLSIDSFTTAIRLSTWCVVLNTGSAVRTRYTCANPPRSDSVLNELNTTYVLFPTLAQETLNFNIELVYRNHLTWDKRPQRLLRIHWRVRHHQRSRSIALA